MAPAIIQSSAINYSPLTSAREIRLVILEPGSDDDPISCRLLHAELGKLEYEALSYEWGDASNEDPDILINGKDVQIRQNLRIALWHLRPKDDERYLWIDAMCIDQWNVLERNHQVELMGKIYSKSKSTIAWLGLPMADSDLAMDRMMEFEALVEREGRDRIVMCVDRPNSQPGLHALDHQDVVGHPGSRSDVSIKSRQIDFPVTTAELDALISIAIRSYWSRMWIIQEIQLPSHLRLHCGRKSISPTTFLSFLEIESANQSSYGYNLGGNIAFFLLDRRRNREHSRRKKKHRKDGLHDWLSGCLAQPLSGFAEPFSCTEPKDLVYALLGISSDCQSGRLKPDYAKHLLEVYEDVFELPARQRWQEDHSSWAPSQTIIYDVSQLRNDLALRLGLISKKKHTENKSEMARVLLIGSKRGRLVWPSGEFKFDPWGTKEVLKLLGVILFFILFVASPVGLFIYCLVLFPHGVPSPTKDGKLE
jgi:hypothetical protein